MMMKQADTLPFMQKKRPLWNAYFQMGRYESFRGRKTAAASSGSCLWFGDHSFLLDQVARKITTYIPTDENREKESSACSGGLPDVAGLTLVVCVLFPLISQYMVIPYLSHLYRSVDDVIARVICGSCLSWSSCCILLPLRFGKEGNTKLVITNLAGENMGEDIAYRGAAGRVVPVTLRNWYMETWFNERKMQLWGYTACGLPPDGAFFSDRVCSMS